MRNGLKKNAVIFYARQQLELTLFKVEEGKKFVTAEKEAGMCCYKLYEAYELYRNESQGEFAFQVQKPHRT